MNKLKQLQEKRGGLVKEARTILDSAKTEAGESRALTGDESTKLINLEKEIDSLATTLDAEMRQYARESQTAPSLTRDEQRTVERFDFSKALSHLHRSAKGMSGAVDGVEAEMFQEGEREARAAGLQSGGIFLPRTLVRRENRDMTASGTTTTSLDQGGMTIATEKRGLLDDFFAASVMRGLGSTVLEGLVGNLDLPRLTAGTTPTKEAENAAADEVSPLTAMLSLSPKRLPAYIDISERLLVQSSVAIEAILRSHLTAQLGSIREAAFWHGGGTNEPTGIAGTSGIGSVAGGTNGLAPTYAHMLSLEEAVDAQNALLGSLAYASNGQIRKKLKGTLENPSGTDATWILGKDGMVNGYQAAFTNAISRTLTKGSSSGVASAIFFGNFADFVEAYWGGISLEMVRDKTNAISGLYTLVASTYYDGGVVRPKSFAGMLDALGA
jgi:HK97 family phage major capsid protein